MVNQTNRLSSQNGHHQAAGSRGLGSSLRELLHDALTLSELQFKLILLDLREGSRQIIAPLVLLVLAVCLTLGCFPVALAALGFVLQLTGLPIAAAFAISAVIGVVVAAAVAFAAVRWLKRELTIFDRSLNELQSNVTWMKKALK